MRSEKKTQEARTDWGSPLSFIEAITHPQSTSRYLKRTTYPEGYYGLTQNLLIRWPRVLHDFASPQRKPRNDATCCCDRQLVILVCKTCNKQSKSPWKKGNEPWGRRRIRRVFFKKLQANFIDSHKWLHGLQANVV
jgi:hypothetical protein